LRNCYPAANGGLQDEIARRGAVISQFWPDTGPAKHHFPMRNAVMSGCAVATVVVEAGEHSGTCSCCRRWPRARPGGSNSPTAPTRRSWKDPTTWSRCWTN
ncbi:DNA-protecting protein DprA, partial [Saccharothrix sp. MB29]|nr:DNA-protecting protein DprA [Saccharothrix sp. MB29]